MADGPEPRDGTSAYRQLGRNQGKRKNVRLRSMVLHRRGGREPASAHRPCRLSCPGSLVAADRKRPRLSGVPRLTREPQPRLRRCLINRSSSWQRTSLLVTGTATARYASVPNSKQRSKEKSTGPSGART